MKKARESKNPKLKKLLLLTLSVCLVFSTAGIAQADTSTVTANGTDSTECQAPLVTSATSSTECLTTSEPTSAVTSPNTDATQIEHDDCYEPAKGTVIGEAKILTSAEESADDLYGYVEGKKLYSSGNSNSAQTSLIKENPTEVRYGRQYLMDQGAENTNNEYYPALVAYDRLVKGLKAKETEIYISITDEESEKRDIDITEANASLAYNLVLEDYPEFFWILGGYVYNRYKLKDGSEVYYVESITPNLCFEEDEIETAQTKFDAEVEEILSEMNTALGDSPTDYDKELWLHDYLIKTDDYIAYAEYAHSAYGAIVEGECVCEGYTRAFQFLLNKCGIESCTIAGYTGQAEVLTEDEITTAKENVWVNHIWNAVKLGDDWYLVDVTWDDQGNDPDDVYHAYFNITSEEMDAGHLAQEEYCDSPECMATTYSYFKQNPSVVFSDTNESEFASNIEAQIKSNGYAVAYAFGNPTEKTEFLVELFNSNYKTIAKDLELISGYTAYLGMGNELHLYLLSGENYVAKYNTVGYLIYGRSSFRGNLKMRIYDADSVVDDNTTFIESCMAKTGKDDKEKVGFVDKTVADTDADWWIDIDAEGKDTGCYYTQFRLPSLPAGDYILAVYDDYYGFNWGEITIKAEPTDKDLDGYGNTVAFNWAVCNYGDVDDLDGINIVDALCLARYKAGWTGYSGYVNTYAADINRDKKIDKDDQNILETYLADIDKYSSIEDCAEEYTAAQKAA